jgi:hypothetical protein
MCLKKVAFKDSVKNSHNNGLKDLWFKLVSKGRQSLFFPLPLGFNKGPKNICLKNGHMKRG